MSCELTLPTRRLRRKTWLGFHVVAETEEAGPLPQHDTSAFVDADFAEEVTGSVKSVYLVTLPALRSGVASRGHVCPSTWSHDEVLRVFLAVFHCDQDSGSESRFQLELMTVFRERHVAGPYHFHVALKASRSFRFAPYKRALHVGHGLATHWSCTHTGYWSAVRYGFMP